MKKILLTACVISAFAINSYGTVVVSYDGDTNDYADFNPAFTGGSSFGVQTPAANYTGPAINGGYELVTVSSLQQWRVDSNVASVNNADTLQASAGFGVTGTVYSAFTFDSSQDFSIDNSSFFRLNARRQGGSTIAGVTGLRWILRDATSGDYFISALNDSSAAQFGSLYSTAFGTATTENDPDTLSWFNYDPTAGVNTGIGSSATIDFGTATFDQGGFYYSNSRTSSGGLVMDFAQFEMDATAIPEPSTFALLGIAFSSLFMLRRYQK